MKIFLHTVVWRLLVISSALTLGFVINAEFVGWKSTATERFVKEKLFSIDYDAQIEELCKTLGRKQLIAELGNPSPDRLKIIKEEVANQESYSALFQFILPDGKQVLAVFQAKVRWKPADYDYSEDVKMSPGKPSQSTPTPAKPKSKTIEIPPPAEHNLHEGALIT